MQPGLTRAVPAAILGFLGACLFVIVLRSLQGLEPVFDAEVGFILAAFVSSFTFVWGMGAADPKMSAHPHGPEVDAETGLIISEAHDDHHEEEEEAEPVVILGFSVWQVAFWTVVLIVGLFAFASLPHGLSMQISGDPAAQAGAVGYETWTIPILGVETQLSQATKLVMITVLIFAGLFVVGGGLGMMFTRLNEGIKEVEQMEQTALPEGPSKEEIADAQNALSAAEYIVFGGLAVVLYGLLYYVLVGVPVEEPAWLRVGLSAFFAVIFAANFTIRPVLLNTIGEGALKFLLFLGASGGLYTAFYYVLIGLPIAGPEWLRWSLSVINAVGAAFTLIYPQVLTHFIGGQAKMVAKALRGLPDGLQ